MNKLLSIEVAVLLLLVIASVFVRVGIMDSTASTTPPDVLQTQPEALPPQTQAPSEPETEPTPPPTEPPVKLTFSEDFSLEAPVYFVYECSRDNVMAASGDLQAKVYPASITKLFTVYVAMQYLTQDQMLTLGNEVNLVPPDSSLAYLKPGQTISVALLVEGMLLPSGNDAANALAVAAARVQSGNPTLSGQKAIDHFADMMNATARALGMTGSHFVNPHGIHDREHYTCIADLITIGKLALENDLIMKYAGTVKDSVPFSYGQTAHWKNTNKLIDPESQYYHPDAIGLKTGNTSAAGSCVLTAFELDGEYILIGTFRCQRPEDRFIDAAKLYHLAAEAIRS